MKGDERDALEVRRTEALESIGNELRRSSTERRRRERDERRHELQRGVDALAGVSLMPLFAGESGQRMLMRSQPGYAALWQVEVPADCLATVCGLQDRQEWPMVSCTCGVWTTLERFSPRECEGYCGRWFLALADSVRVKRFGAAA